MGLSLITYALSKKYTDLKTSEAMEIAIAEAVAAANAYTDAVATQIEWKKAFVEELPPISEADEHTIYFVPASEQPVSDGYFEYIVANGEWEVIGRTTVDMSNYYTKAEVEEYVAEHAYEMTPATYSEMGGVIIDENTMNVDGNGKISLSTVDSQEIMDLFSS